MRRAVDAFCGAGGASKGLDDAGYEVVGFDHWQPAVDTHNTNGLKAHLHDLSDPALDTAIPDCDLMWLSCPCQPFSAAGDGEGEFDERDGFPWGLRILAERLPAVAIFENVKGLTFGKHHAYFAGILESLRALGYEVDWKVLNTADYGVPQTRERCFIVCRRDGGPITWPMPTHTAPAGMFTQPWVTMAQALGWGDGAAIRYNRGAGLIERPGERPHPFNEPSPSITGNSEKDYKVILDYRQNDGATGEPILLDVTERPAPTVGTKSEGQWLVRAGRDANATVRSIEEPAPTVLARKDANAWTLERPATTIGDPRVSAPGRHDPEVSGSQQAGAIRLTIAELAALQGFPVDWVWTGTKTSQARQVGNAVPPIMARLLAEANRPIEQEMAA